MKLILELTHGEDVRAFEFHRPMVSVGRGPFNDLVVPGGEVPMRHATLNIDEDGTVRVRCDAEHRPLRIEGASGRRESSGAWCEIDVGSTVILNDAGNVRLRIVTASGDDQPVLRLVEAGGTPPAAEQLVELAESLASSADIDELLAQVENLVASTVGVRPTRTALQFTASAEEFVSDAHARETSETLSVPDLLQGRPGVRRLLRDGSEQAVITTLSNTVRVTTALRIRDDAVGLLELRLPLETDSEAIDASARTILHLRPFLCLAALRNRDSRTRRALEEENRYFRGRERRRYLFKEIVCESASMKRAYATLHDLAAVRAPVLFAGEAGTGKELLARSLHHLGPHSNDMFIGVNCSDLPEDLLDRELFGCAAGEVEGSVAPRKGIFELVGEGTVFLEEVDLLPAPLQAKLCRMIKEGEVRRAGEVVGRPVRARLVASVHRDLATLVSEGRIRRDLYLMFDEDVLEVPPLRERRADILPLAENFIRVFARRYGKPDVELSEQARERLSDYGWPGNVRELQSRIESAVLQSDGVIGPDELTSGV